MERRIQTVLRLMAALGAIAAPALFAQMAIAQNAQAQAPYQAQTAPTLPPPPYASMDRPSSYGGHQVYDRYGGGTTHPRVQTAAGAPAYAGPRLMWSGKTDAAPGVRSASPYGQAYAAAQPSAQAVAHGWTFVPPIGAPAPNAPASRTMAPIATPAPTSIYDPVPPAPQAPQAPAVQPQAQASGDGPRRYSVHREFGQEPDPIPIPPQFFGATADLTQPETPEPQRRTVGADGKARNPIQPTDGQ